MLIKVGVLVPSSNYIPLLSRDLVSAIELGLGEVNGVGYELYVEPGGYNADSNVLSLKIQELLVKHQVDVVVAPLNVGLLERVNPYFSSQQVPLVVISLGEDVVFSRYQSPFLFVNSFNIWQSAWLAGYWGAEEYGLKACSICALHDGGYGMPFSFGLGLEAQDGKLLQAAVTHRESREEDPSEFIKMIAANNPDFIMGFYSGKESVSFLNAYHNRGYWDKIPLIGLPFMVDDSLLNVVGNNALGIKSIYCWSQNTEEHRHFTDAFKNLTGHRVNCYVLLAYETGHLIARAVQQIGMDKPVHGQLPEALKAVEFKGPRGMIKFDPDTREVQTSNYLREVVQGEDGRLYNRIVAELETPDLFYEQLALARKNLVKQGWLNPYLIA